MHKLVFSKLEILGSRLGISRIAFRANEVSYVLHLRFSSSLGSLYYRLHIALVVSEVWRSGFIVYTSSARPNPNFRKLDIQVSIVIRELRVFGSLCSSFSGNLSLAEFRWETRRPIKGLVL